MSRFPRSRWRRCFSPRARTSPHCRIGAAGGAGPWRRHRPRVSGAIPIDRSRERAFTPQGVIGTLRSHRRQPPVRVRQSPGSTDPKLKRQPKRNRRQPSGSVPKARATRAGSRSRTFQCPANYPRYAARTVQPAVPKHHAIEFCCPPGPHLLRANLLMQSRCPACRNF
jgi:hypothetical protein